MPEVNEAVPQTPAMSAARPQRYLAVWVVLGVLLAGAIGLAVVMATSSSGPSTPRSEVADGVAPDFDFVIPAGTAARLDAGEKLDLVPGVINAKVGQVVRIRNLDERAQVVGPWFVGAGETVTQRFTAPGRLEGECGIHSSGKVVVEVTE
jgi:hypothetical protein